MKLGRLATAILLGSTLALPIGCGGGEESPGEHAESVEELPPKMQEEIKGYENTGRFGPAGQSKPDQKTKTKPQGGQSKGSN